MHSNALNDRERVARLIIGGVIMGVAFSGGFKTKFGKSFVTILGAFSLLEGLVNQHLIEYFNIARVK